MTKNSPDQRRQYAHLASRNESIGFARRTLANLDHIEKIHASGGDTVHVVTQRTISLLGLIVFPWERGFDDNIKNIRLDELERDGWPRWKIIQGRENSQTLGSLVKKLRNAVCHRRLQFSSDSSDPSDVAIEFADATSRFSPPHWRAEIGADDLYEFCRRFSYLVDNTLG